VVIGKRKKTASRYFDPLNSELVAIQRSAEPIETIQSISNARPL